MSNFTNMVIFVMAINLCLVAVYGASSGVPFSDVFAIIQDPSLLLTGSYFINLILGTVTAIGAIALVTIGIAFKSDIMLKAGLVLIFASFINSLAILYTHVYDALGYWPALFIIAPLTILYIMTLLNWWFGRAT